MNTIKLSKMVIALAIMLTIGLTYVVPIYAAGSSTLSMVMPKPINPPQYLLYLQNDLEPTEFQTSDHIGYVYIPIIVNALKNNKPVINTVITIRTTECDVDNPYNCYTQNHITKTDTQGQIIYPYVVQPYINGKDISLSPHNAVNVTIDIWISINPQNEVMYGYIHKEFDNMRVVYD